MKISPVNSINKFSTKKVCNNCSEMRVQSQPQKQIVQISNNYYSPFISFGRTYSTNRPELYEIPARFQFTKFDNLPCPACGKKMMPRQKYAEFQARLEDTKPTQYLYLLGEYEEYMRPIEHSVYKEILALSSEQETSDIRELVVALRKKKLPQLQSIQRRKLIQMKKIARGLPANERAALSAKLSELGKQIKKKSEEAPFRRKKMIQEIKEVKISNPYKYEKLQNLAKAFPTSTDTNSAWIVKYSGKNKYNQDWTSKEIAERMLYHSVPNTDHIIPYGTEKGHDDISNYLAMHSGCNSNKTNKPFIQWYNESPELRQKSLVEYFVKTQEVINSGKIRDPKYENYVAYATDTIEHVSKGQIQLSFDSEFDEEDMSMLDGIDFEVAYEEPMAESIGLETIIETNPS